MNYKIKKPKLLTLYFIVQIWLTKTRLMNESSASMRSSVMASLCSLGWLSAEHERNDVQ